MGATIPKQFMMLGQEPVLARTINLFSEALPKAELVVVLPEEHIALWRNIAARFDVAPHKIASGGKERFDSVKSGLAALSDEVETIAVHDAVRPLATKKLIIRLALAAEDAQAVIPVIAPHDSIRQVEGERSYIVDRSQLRMVQTPQFFQAEVLRRAYEQSFSPLFTDDASVVEAAGGEVTLIEGEVQNIKITTTIDLTIAEAILAEKDEA